MKTSIVLALALAVALVAGWAAAAPARHVAAHAAVRHVAHRTALRRVSRRHVVRHRRHHRRTVATNETKATPAAAVSAPDDGKLGFFKADGKAGWGWRRPGSVAVVGLYKRPQLPVTPHSNLYEDTKGTAGVSVSIKLGH